MLASGAKRLKFSRGAGCLFWDSALPLAFVGSATGGESFLAFSPLDVAVLLSLGGVVCFAFWLDLAALAYVRDLTSGGKFTMTAARA